MTALALSPQQLRRANTLDTLAAILPPGDRDKLAALLTDDDVATLKHLVEQGLGRNTLRALAGDLAYITAWCYTATGTDLPWPAPQPLLLKFIAHHLWDPAERASNPGHGMPQHVMDALTHQGILRRNGPHTPATVRRRLALWATLHRWRGLIGPFKDPHVRTALATAVRAAARPQSRKSAKALTRDILDKLLETCRPGRLVDLRDRAILLVGFASGGRRRSEIARLLVSQISFEPPVLKNPKDQSSARLPCAAITLGRTKTEDGDKPVQVFLVGRAAEALSAWLEASGITEGPVFRAIGRWGGMGPVAISPEAINGMIKRRCRQAGLDPALYSAHGLRSGYLTEAARQGVNLLDAMQQSRHASVQQAKVYYNEAMASDSRAARLAE